MRISSLTIYPIKSCRGIALREAQVVPGGLRFDRRYMLVDADGTMVTGRKLPELITVETELLSENRIALHGAGQPSLELSLEPDSELADELPVSVWSDGPRAALHPRGSAWFRQRLGRDLRLVFLPERELRQVNPTRAQVGDLVSFADAYPLLVTNEASLAELNQRLASPLGMERFRPNVVVEASEAFDEDTWQRVELGKLTGSIAKLCDRCVITTVDPDTGQRGKEPLKTLATFRKWDGAVWFGANFVPDRAALPALLRVGDEVLVRERRPHPRG